MGWLPDGFVTPDRMDLPTGHHLRPIREADVDIDLPAVMDSRERLWARYGEAWGWPPATMTHEQDREDLAHHEREIAAQESFNYAVLDEAETELLGCVYIDPPEAAGPADAEAVASWWVVDAHAGRPLEHALDVAVPRWLADVWGFGRWVLHPPQVG
jgi:RimJ/RimL family protein N-acetyltransferase